MIRQEKEHSQKRLTRGKLIGLGSACPSYELSYRGSKADPYYGEALAIVEAGEAGTVILTVTDGKQSVKTAVTVLRQHRTMGAAGFGGSFGPSAQF